MGPGARFSERPLVSGEEEVTSGFIMLENGFGVMQTKRPEGSWAYEEGEGETETDHLLRNKSRRRTPPLKRRMSSYSPEERLIWLQVEE